MKIGLAYDLKSTVEPRPGAPEDAAEEYDPPSTIDALAAEVESLGHQPVRLGGGAAFLRAIPDAAVDFVFNIAEGRGSFRSREAQVPGVLEMLGIPYSGSDPLTLAISLDKPLTKQIVQMAGVDTPRSAVVRSPEELPMLRSAGLRYPLVVKPAAEGSSKGIRATSKAATWEELVAATTAVLENYRQPALVEEFIAGTEITVGLVGNRPPRVVGVMEVVPKTAVGADFMYTLEVKRDWKRLVSYRCPPALPDETVRAIEHAAITAFEAIQCRDVARVDFRVDAHGRPYFLEINPLPGLGDYSDLVLMAEIVGMGYSKLVQNILDAALSRHGLGAAPRRHGLER